MKTSRQLTTSQLQHAVEQPWCFGLNEFKDHIANPEIRLYVDLMCDERYMSFLYGNEDNQRYSRLVKVSRSDFSDAGLSKDRHAYILLRNFPHEFTNPYMRSLDAGLSRQGYEDSCLSAATADANAGHTYRAEKNMPGKIDQKDIEHGKELVRMAAKVGYWKNRSEELNAELLQVKRGKAKAERQVVHVLTILLLSMIAMSVIQLTV